MHKFSGKLSHIKDCRKVVDENVISLFLLMLIISPYLRLEERTDERKRKKEESEKVEALKLR